MELREVTDEILFVVERVRLPRLIFDSIHELGILADAALRYSRQIPAIQSVMVAGGAELSPPALEHEELVETLSRPAMCRNCFQPLGCRSQQVRQQNHIRTQENKNRRKQQMCPDGFGAWFDPRVVASWRCKFSRSGGSRTHTGFPDGF